MRNVILEGKVKYGRQIGRTIGFRTANLDIKNKDTSLPMGVYGVKVLYNTNWYFGVMNVGVRPTFKDDCSISYEVHIFEFNQDIYHQSLRVEVNFFLRGEQTFSTPNHLVKQIQRDIHLVKERFNLLPFVAAR
ncbi:riboflavin kinase [Priestia megaterium]